MDQLTPLEQELVQMIIEECNVFEEPEGLTPDSPIVGPDSPFELDIHRFRKSLFEDLAGAVRGLLGEGENFL